MADALDVYNKNRDFHANPEPLGAKKNARKKKSEDHALQFCIQKHDASRLHYDFRIEIEGTLKSRAVPKGPSLDPQVKRQAMEVEDHPLNYATYEGNIPEGHYGAGDVTVWDRGIWKCIGDPVGSYKKGKLKFELEGEKLGGLWNLVRTHQEGKSKPWFLIKHQDSAAKPEAEFDVVKELPDSVLSDRTIIPKKRGKQPKAKSDEEVPEPRKQAKSGKLTGAKPAPLPDLIKPQLATLVETAPSEDWRYEIKFDGYRMMARIDNGEVKLFTRNGHDWTSKLPRQAEALSSLALESAWLDGEVIAADDEGVPSFQILQNAFESGKSQAIVFYLFDMPYLNGVDLREVPVEERRAALAQVVERSEDDIIRFSEDFGEEASDLLTSVCQMHMEGLIGKRAGSTYVSRRSDDWIKLKCKHRQEFVVVGYSEPKGARTSFGALLLGLHDKDSGELRYSGKVGTGFNERTLRTILEQLKPLETSKPAVVNPPTGADARGVHWLKPELLAEVAYAEITKDGSVRHSVFHGLRTDKPAKEITEETPVPASDVQDKKTKPAAKKKPVKADPKPTSGKIRITHPDRVIAAGSSSNSQAISN